MNPNLAHTLDSLFGPASDPIDVSAFLESPPTITPSPLTDQEDFTTDVVDECRYRSHSLCGVPVLNSISFSIQDVRNSLNEIWSNPALSAYLIKDHDRTVTALYTHSQKSTKSSRKTNQPPQTLSAEVADLHKNLEGIALSSFRYPSITFCISLFRPAI
jgi:hypothetical protein